MRRECVGGLARVLPTLQLVALAVVIVAALAGSATATAAGTAPRCEPVDLGIHRGATEGESGVATTTLQFVNVTGGRSKAPSCTSAQLRLSFLGGVGSTVWEQSSFTFAES